MLLILQSWMWVLYFDYLMLVRGFDAVHAAVRRRRSASPHPPITDHHLICHAADLACVFYFKPVLCLQRSAATIILLRRHGWQAEMVIGAQLLPFQSHAWVEIRGTVVNDKPYINQIFQVLDRC
jgi:transglutaminase superfamily protein